MFARIKKSHTFGALFALAFYVGMTLRVHAAGLVPCGGPGEEKCELRHLFVLLAGIYNFLLGLSAIVAVLMIVLSGLRMLTYFWDENPGPALESAKNSLRRAIFGFIIIVAAYLVVNTLLASILGAGPLSEFLEDIRGL